MDAFRKILKLGGKKGYLTKFLVVLELAFSLGFTIAILIGGGAVFGAYLDKKLNLAPKMTMSFIFLGTILAIGRIFQIVKKPF